MVITMKTLPEEIEKNRKPEYAISHLILSRWSPRAMSGDKITDEELMALFEAARWAPSSYNNQPWRFIYAKRNTDHWNRLFNLMVEFNQSWAKNAAVLIVIISKKTFDHNNQPSITHSFDTGAAWENLALQAESMGLAAHGMQGFDYEKAKKELGIPDSYNVEAMVAIGKIGRKEDLSKELQEREVPSGRKPLKDLIMGGKFKA